MKYEYGNEYGVCEVEPAPNGKWHIHIVWVEPEYRGQGRAKEMLQRVVDDADREDVVLYLTPEPLEPNIYRAGLHRLYESVGFVAMCGSHLYMERDPCKVPAKSVR